MSRILLAGATGLVGRSVLPLLLHAGNGAASRVLVAGRRVPRIDHPSLRCLQVDFAAPEAEAHVRQAIEALGGVDTYVSCLGTTLRQAGSRSALAAVDRDLVLQLGRMARDAGATRVLLVSSVGADADSRSFYLRTKGEVEAGLRDIGFERCDFLRPGLLRGPRRGEPRFGEWLAQQLSPLTDPLLRGPLRRYRSIRAIDVGAALVALLAHTQPGVHVHEHAALTELAAS